MTADFVNCSATEITSGIRSKEFSALEVCNRFLERIQNFDGDINSFTLVTADRARQEAQIIDTQIAKGEQPGPLAGVPFAAKNLFDIEGEVTLAGSKINASYPPAERDATAVARLKKAGALCLGANTMGEYAYDFITQNAHHGACKNPHDGKHSAGGSSGGSGACIAAGLATLSLGTDTNGSVRVPSSFCGIWGLKPTYGRLSRAGSFPFAGSLDTIGIFARNVADLSCSYDAIAGADERDAVCTALAPDKTKTQLTGGLPHLRLAALDGYFSTSGLAHIDKAFKAVKSALKISESLQIADVELARAAAYVITSAEGGAMHFNRLKGQAGDFDPGMRDRFLAGSLTPANWYLKAQKFRRYWSQKMAGIFSQYDVLIAPATPLCAPQLDQTHFKFRGNNLDLRPNIGLFTQPITLIGLPVIAAPVHEPAALPTAVQLIAKPYDELKLLRVAHYLEQEGVCSAPLAKKYS